MDAESTPFISHKLRFALSCWALLLVPLGLLTLFVYVPVAWAFAGSLFAFEVGGEAEFVGLANYYEFLFVDPTTWQSMGNMLFITGFVVAVRLTLPLIAAKLIHSVASERTRYAYRIVFLIPIVVPVVAVQLIWFGMIYSDRGMANETLRLIGLHEWALGWLNDPRTALWAVVFVGFPWINGIDLLIYYAGLSNIPSSVNEAAKLEGCVGIRKFFLIDVPMVMSQIKLIMILAIVAGVQTFENILILTEGGPGFETAVPALLMYFNAFSYQRMGYACAVGVCLFFIIFGLTLINLRYFRSREDLEGGR